MPPPSPVIIDCDPGTDDAIALLLAAASPELDLRAITVVGGNAGLACTLANASGLAALAGIAAPVHAGAAGPLLRATRPAPAQEGTDDLSGTDLPPGVPTAPGVAADAIRAILRAAAEPVTLIGIGPATNLALALATEPAVAAKVGRIVLMAGAWGEGNITPSAEFNAHCDPEALAIVLAAGPPVSIVPLELTRQAPVTPTRLAALAARAGGRSLRTACALLAAMGAGDHPLHDPCAVAWTIRPELFSARQCAVAVDLGPGPSRGRTVIDRRGRLGAPPNATVLETIDADRFFDLLGVRLATLP